MTRAKKPSAVERTAPLFPVLDLDAIEARLDAALGKAGSADRRTAVVVADITALVIEVRRLRESRRSVSRSRLAAFDLATECIRTIEGLVENVPRSVSFPALTKLRNRLLALGEESP